MNGRLRIFSGSSEVEGMQNPLPSLAFLPNFGRGRHSVFVGDGQRARRRRGWMGAGSGSWSPKVLQGGIDPKMEGFCWANGSRLRIAMLNTASRSGAFFDFNLRWFAALGYRISRLHGGLSRLRLTMTNRTLAS